jgi:hypothetical protein
MYKPEVVCAMATVFITDVRRDRGKVQLNQPV